MPDPFAEDGPLRRVLAESELIDRELGRQSLKDFLVMGWEILEPGHPFSDNWHIGAICEHLEAVSRGEIRNLIINIPPRCMKSLTTSVFWPTWWWLSEPSRKFLNTSYALQLSIRDNLKARRLIESEWFKIRWPEVKLVTDQYSKQRFENNQRGARVASSVGGAATGEGGDVIICDDPHNVVEGESDVVRQATLEWWDEVMSTRLNDPATGHKVVIMQRVHENDLSGHLLEEMGTYEHLMLPMEYEADHPHIGTTSIGFTDARTKDGDLLWPTRIPETAVKELQNAMGPYAYAGQMQQRPAPREGGLFKVKNVDIVVQPSAPIVSTIRSWDKAATKDDGAYTCGVKIARLANGRWCVLDVRRGQWSTATRERIIRLTAEEDGVGTPIIHEQEPGSGGKDSAASTTRNLSGFRVIVQRPTGDKATRAEPWAVQMEVGNIEIVSAPFVNSYLGEHRNFPNSRYADQVDASTQGFNYLAIHGAVTWESLYGESAEGSGRHNAGYQGEQGEGGSGNGIDGEADLASLEVLGNA